MPFPRGSHSAERSNRLGARPDLGSGIQTRSFGCRGRFAQVFCGPESLPRLAPAEWAKAPEVGHWLGCGGDELSWGIHLCARLSQTLAIGSVDGAVPVDHRVSTLQRICVAAQPAAFPPGPDRLNAGEKAFWRTFPNRQLQNRARRAERSPALMDRLRPPGVILARATAGSSRIGVRATPESRTDLRRLQLGVARNWVWIGMTKNTAPT